MADLASTRVFGTLTVAHRATVEGGQVWHSNNHGADSGLDADLLDGHHASHFATKAEHDAHLHDDRYLRLTGGSVTGAVSVSGNLTLGGSLQSTGVVSFLNDGNAQAINVNNLLVSNSYADRSQVPVNGLFVKGNVKSAGVFEGSGSGLTNVNAAQLGGKTLATVQSDYAAADAAVLASANSYTDTSVAALVASSPEALDTLAELAAALGDDPNFATTVTNQIALKLDAASYTAADVLAKIKTVDGAGSGLDADLLDGQSGEFYRNGSNINAGVIPAAHLGTGTRSTSTYLRGDGAFAALPASATLSSVSQAEAEAGTATATRLWTAQRVHQAINARVSGQFVLDRIASMGPASGLDADLLDGKHLATIESEYAAGDAQTLVAAKTYADAHLATAQSHATSQAASALSSANSYTDSSVAALVASSPEALDTLNELASALGNDPNFATTMTNHLAQKLDAAEYTAADVLEKVKLVDGSGSGIDADLLDGQDGSYYRNAANLNVGTLPSARLTGTYAISVSGNAATATKLTTARTINGVAFDGSANITITANPNAHTHPWADVTGAPATATRWPTWSEVTSKPSVFAPEAHAHTLAEIADSGSVAAINTNGSTANYLRGDGTWVTPPNTTYSVISTAEIDAGTATTSRVITAQRIKYIMDQKADAIHGHGWDDLSSIPETATRWPTWSEVTSKPATFSPSSHTHPWAEVTGAPASATRWPTWTEVTSKPTTFAPSAHNHSATDITSGTIAVARLPAEALIGDTTYSAGSGIALTGTAFSVAAGDGLTQQTGGLAVDASVVRTSGNQTLAGVKTFSGVIQIDGASSSPDLIVRRTNNTINANIKFETTSETDTFIGQGDSGHFSVGSGNDLRYANSGVFSVDVSNGNVRWKGTATGDGSGLTALDAGNLATGTVANARLPTTATRWPTWTEVTSKPSTFAPSAHNHPWAEVTGAPATATRWPTWSEVTSKPTTFAPSAHTHVAGDLPSATTSAVGVVQLNNTLTSTSTTQAATANAVKLANDAAVAANTNANNRVAKSGDTMTGLLTVPSLKITAGTGIGFGTANPSSAYNINMNDSFSVDGTRAAIYSIANILDGALTAARTHYGIYNSLRNDYLSGDSFALTQRGAHNEVLNGPANDAEANINTATGSYNYVLNRANGPVGTAHGSFNYVLNSRPGATTSNAFGSYDQVAASDGTITNAYGVYALVRPTASTATISNGYLFYGTNSTVTGTFTNRYGVYIASGVNNYFAGGIQVGGTAAGGTSRAGLGVGVTPPGAGNISASGTISGNGSGLTTLNASNLSSGTVPNARLSGSYDGLSHITGSTFRGNASDSVSAPAHTWAADTNTGMYRVSDTEIGWTINGTKRGGLNSSGNFTVTGNVTAYSDARVKTDVEAISGALSKVMRISGYTFTRTDLKNAPRQTGVVAQEVLEVLPEAVIQQDDGKLAVAYGNMVGLLIEAIKELNREVNLLKERLDDAA